MVALFSYHAIGNFYARSLHSQPYHLSPRTHTHRPLGAWRAENLHTLAVRIQISGFCGIWKMCGSCMHVYFSIWNEIPWHPKMGKRTEMKSVYTWIVCLVKFVVSTIVTIGRHWGWWASPRNFPRNIFGNMRELAFSNAKTSKSSPFPQSFGNQSFRLHIQGTPHSRRPCSSMYSSHTATFSRCVEWTYQTVHRKPSE